MTVEDLIEELRQQPLTAQVRIVGGAVMPTWADDPNMRIQFDRSPECVTYSHGEVVVACLEW